MEGGGPIRADRASQSGRHHSESASPAKSGRSPLSLVLLPCKLPARSLDRGYPTRNRFHLPPRSRRKMHVDASCSRRACGALLGQCSPFCSTRSFPYQGHPPRALHFLRLPSYLLRFPLPTARLSRFQAAKSSVRRLLRRCLIPVIRLPPSIAFGH